MIAAESNSLGLVNCMVSLVGGKTSRNQVDVKVNDRRTSTKVNPQLDL